MAWYTVSDSAFTSVANAIRTKGGTSSSMTFPDGFVSAINDISGGGGDDALVTRVFSSSYYENNTASIVGAYAFASCSGLHEVSFGAATEVGISAFNGCHDLETLHFPECITLNDAFRSCSNISRVTSDCFPKCETLVGGVFRSLPNLEYMDFPALMSLSGTADKYSSNYMSTKLSYVGLGSVSVIPSYWFSRTSSLITVSAPCVTTVGSYAFCSCLSLANFDLSNIVEFGSYAFSGCALSGHLDIWSDRTYGAGAFSGCQFSEVSFHGFSVIPNIASGLKSVITANFGGATSVGTNAFYWCTSLSSIIAPPLTSISYGGFCGCGFSAIPSFVGTTIKGFNLCQNITKLSAVDIPTVQAFGSGAFDGCSNLSYIDLPDLMTVGSSALARCGVSVSGGMYVSLPRVRILWSYAFQGANITSINLPSLIDTLGIFAFSGCLSLTVADIGGTITMVGQHAFDYCFNLISLYLRGSSVARLQSAVSSTFKSSPIGGYSASAGQYGTVYVPASLVDAYRSLSYWSTISSQIIAIPE